MCGQNTDYYELRTSEIHVISGTTLDLTFPEEANIWFLRYRCFNVSFEIPKGQKDLEIDFILSGIAYPQVGCVNVTLHLESQNFLGNSF